MKRLSIDALGALSDEELAARVGVPESVAPVLRGARDLREAREYAEHVLEPEPVAVDAPETLTRFRELVEGGLDARSVVRELKAVGGDLKAVRLVLTGRERGPELAAVIAALPRDELLRRAASRLGRDAPLQHAVAAARGAAAAARAGADVLLRPDRLPAGAHRQRAAVRRRHVAARLAQAAAATTRRSSTTSPT